MQATYTAQPLGGGVTAIQEGGVRSFLLEGEEKALLVDTGYGTGDLCAFVQTLTALPVLLANTHADPDHIGGNGHFAVPAMLHQKDIPRFMQRGGSPNAVLPLVGGEVLNLGGRALTVVHVPGHTPGSIVLFNAQSGDLVAGDTVQNDPVYMFGPGRDMPAYIESLHLLLGLGAKRVLCAHGEVQLPASFIPALYADAKAALAGEILPVEVEVHGHRVEEYKGQSGAFLCERQRPG